MNEPTYLNHEAFHVLGIAERIEPANADFDELWSRCRERYSELEMHRLEDGRYGVYFAAGKPRTADFIAGVAAAPSVETPSGLVLREVPAALYAVFECGFSDVPETCPAAFQEWLPRSGYEADTRKAAFEYFPPGSSRGEAPVRIHLPLYKASR